MVVIASAYTAQVGIITLLNQNTQREMKMKARYSIKLLQKTGSFTDIERVIVDSESKTQSDRIFGVKRMAVRACTELNGGKEKNDCNWFKG